jgi:hypothetical protein
MAPPLLIILLSNNDFIKYPILYDGVESSGTFKNI